MLSVFDVVPGDFFTILSSKNRNQAVYSELLLKIYSLFDNEISYRILRDLVRDTIAAYLLENHIEIQGEDATELGLESDWNIKANFISRRRKQKIRQTWHEAICSYIPLPRLFRE